ncbi:uncharacterized protein LOC6734819 [Drosophila simulans]|uniref:Uncharacterized protein n=3 Tax=melanogaster subgroup TaxID=32351 RepID=A0A0J9REF3_DROSI|nr:uncharacterized protein LOC6734819 [Drosophila simulans]KMY94367.1 uncharacterized protein Dsimw501_GD11220 [Drosophila simulans]
MKAAKSGDRMAYPWIKMRPLLMLTLLLVIFFSYCLAGKTTTIVSHTDTLDPQADGFWANKTTWNARWVKYWRAKKIYEPVWKKVWTPTIHNEWVPLPNVPNEWEAEKDRSYKDQ